MRFVVQGKHLTKTINKYMIRNVLPIIDYAVENNKDKYTFLKKYTSILQKYPNNYHALKLSGIDTCNICLNYILKTAMFTNNNILIDAENVDIQNKIDHMTNNSMIIYDKKLPIFKTYQMYRKDSLALLESDIRYFSSINSKLNIKLVRGAYLHKDHKTNMIFSTKKGTDSSYNDAIQMILDNESAFDKVIFATHNKESYNKIKHLSSNKYCHASLMGFENAFVNDDSNIRKMVYVPFGPYIETLPYLLRRFYENPIKWGSINGDS